MPNMRYPAQQCVRLPSSASLADGAIIEPLAVALHGVMLSGLKPRDKVLVLGAGPIGLAVAFWARRMGAAQVVVQDIADWQQERALADGRDVFVVDPADPVGAAPTARSGGKADIVFECVGVPGLIAQAVEQVRNAARSCCWACAPGPTASTRFAMLQKEVRLVTSASSSARIRGRRSTPWAPARPNRACW